MFCSIFQFVYDNNMFLEHDMNLAEMQRLNQKIETLDENLNLTADEVKAKSAGE